MTKPISWNTGRAYSETGQLIFAYVRPDKHVVFDDVTRHIAGITNHPSRPHFTSELHIRDRVMWDYDHHQYTDSYSAEWNRLTKGD